jgi:hypothetical protein
MKQIFLIFLMAISTKIIAQNNQVILNKSAQIEIGISQNGSGDIGGFAINSEFNNYFKRKWSYLIGLGATIHDDAKPIYYNDSNGNYVVDSEYRYTIAGFQLSGKMGYSFVRNIKNDFGIRFGALLRYQSDSSSGMATYYNPQTYPFPVVRLDNNSPQSTFAIGGIVQLYYNYSINDKLFVGTSGAFQTDTNGDAISHLSLTFGTKF